MLPSNQDLSKSPENSMESLDWHEPNEENLD